jgi:hypothetical protein
MDNHSIPNHNVFRKLLSLLPFEKFSSGYLDTGVKKLTTVNLLRICIAMQVGNWSSYSEAEEQICSMKNSEELFGLKSIIGSQISRRINNLPSIYAQQLFLAAVLK